MKIDKFSPNKAGKICLFFFCHSFFHIYSFLVRARENKAFPPFPLFFPSVSSKGYAFPYFSKALKTLLFFSKRKLPFFSKRSLPVYSYNDTAII